MTHIMSTQRPEFQMRKRNIVLLMLEFVESFIHISNKKSFQLWDLTAGKMLQDFKQHSGPVNTVEFHPNEFLLASGSSDRTVKFWDLETFQPVSSSDGESSAVR